MDEFIKSLFLVLFIIFSIILIVGIPLIMARLADSEEERRGC